MLEDTFNALKKNEIVFLQENKELLSLTCTDAGIFASVEDTLQKTLMMGRFRLFGKISAGDPLTRISLLIHKYHAQKEIMLDNDLFSAMMTTLASRCMVLPLSLIHILGSSRRAFDFGRIRLSWRRERILPVSGLCRRGIQVD